MGSSYKQTLSVGRAERSDWLVSTGMMGVGDESMHDLVNCIPIT